MRSLLTTFLFLTIGFALQAAPRNQSGHLKLRRMRVLTTHGGRLDWGPDGRIVFDRKNRSGPRKGLYDLWITDPDNPEKEVCISRRPGLPVGHRGNPSWHPSGKWILFQAGVKVGNKLVTHPGSGVANELWVIRPDGSDPRELFDIPNPRSMDGSLHPHFDSDGDRIVFSRFRGLPFNFTICLLPFDVANPRKHSPQEVLPAGDPRWRNGLYETHGFSPDDRHVVFTGCVTKKGNWKNDILVADPLTRNLVDPVTNSPDWDEHAHFQPGSRRLLWSSSRDLGPVGWNFLASRADWWIREEDGTHHRLTYFEDRTWSRRKTTLVGGKPIEILDSPLFAADGSFSPDGKRFAGVLLYREWRAREWIVILDLEESAPRVAPH